MSERDIPQHRALRQWRGLVYALCMSATDVKGKLRRGLNSYHGNTSYLRSYDHIVFVLQRTPTTLASLAAPLLLRISVVDIYLSSHETEILIILQYEGSSHEIQLVWHTLQWLYLRQEIVMQFLLHSIIIPEYRSVSLHLVSHIPKSVRVWQRLIYDF
jgi:hypothetical protein